MYACTFAFSASYKQQDILTVGVNDLSFNITLIPFEFVTSGLRTPAVSSLQSLLPTLDIMLSPVFTDNTTHIITGSVKATEKILRALASAIPIVGENYVKVLCEWDGI